MKNFSKVKKAIITAAGYGTRFLPATKNQPKEMLPIIDIPIIHYLVKEAVDSGIEQIIIVNRFGSHPIEDYFDNHSELEYVLEKSGKEHYLKMIQDIPKMASFVYVRQKKHFPYGNGTPLLASKDLIDDDEAFVYMFGDDVTLSKDVPITKQLIDVYKEQKPSAVLGVQEVPWDEIERYGSVEYKENADYKYEISKVLEKLPKDKAPSNMAQFGRFVLSYDTIEAIEKTATGKGGELWLTDVLNSMANEGKKVIAQPIKGEWLTTGDPLRYLKTTLKFAMEREEIKEELLQFIREEII